MFSLNCFDLSFLKNTCGICLKISDDLRPMTAYEESRYVKNIKESFYTSYFHICVYCAHILKKFNNFILQCHEAHSIIEKHLEEEDTKPNYFSQLSRCHNLTTTLLPTIDVSENTDDCDNSTLFEDEAGLDDQDLPLVMLKKDGSELKEESMPVVKVRKKKKKYVNVKENINNTDSSVIEATTDLSKGPSVTKRKCVRKTKKEVREGFSSRMVQETEEYVVIKLTKEQVLQEMEERSKSQEYLRTLFKCHKCVKGFNFEDVLRTHMEKHSVDNGPLQCEICNQYCPSAVSLRGHMKSHTTRYKCKVCDCVRQSRQHLLEHHATQHTRGALRYSCHQCDFNTTKRTSIQRHVKSHRPVERHACHQCGKLFKSLETLRVHTMRHDKSSALQCDTCSRVFIYPSLLHRHVQAVHVRKDYYCVECDTEFKSRENLRLHFKKAKKHRDASSYQFECNQCSERFVSASTLSTHVTSAHGEDKRHPCGSCRRLYSSREALRAHARAKHTPAKNQACEVCNKTFTRDSVLSAHMRSHAEQRKKLEDCNIIPDMNQTLLES